MCVGVWGVIWSFLSFQKKSPGVEFRSLGLTASLFTCCASLNPFFFIFDIKPKLVSSFLPSCLFLPSAEIKGPGHHSNCSWLKVREHRQLAVGHQEVTRVHDLPAKDKQRLRLRRSLPASLANFQAKTKVQVLN